MVGTQVRTRRGVLRDALGVGVAVGASGVAFGGTGVADGLTVAQSCALSLLAFTGASQYAFVAAIAAGGNPLVGALGAWLLGARNSFYGLRLAPLLELRSPIRLAAAHIVLDETTAVTLAQPDRRYRRLGFGVTGITLFLLWNATTLAGALGATALGDPSRYGLDVAGPAAFLALLVPQLRAGRDRAGSRVTAGAAGRRVGTPMGVAVLAAAIALATTPLLPTGVPILLAVIAVTPALLATRRSPA